MDLKTLSIQDIFKNIMDLKTLQLRSLLQDRNCNNDHDRSLLQSDET